MADLERQLSWGTRAYSNTIDLRRADYTQLLRQVPQVSQLSMLDPQGREQLRLSRRTVKVGSNLDFSRDVSFTEARARGTGYAPAYFRGEQPAKRKKKS
jgi:adenylate cyclase